MNPIQRVKTNDYYILIKLSTSDNFLQCGLQGTDPLTFILSYRSQEWPKNCDTGKTTVKGVIIYNLKKRTWDFKMSGSIRGRP